MADYPQVVGISGSLNYSIKTIEKTNWITWSSTSLLTRDGTLGGSSLADSRCLQPTLLHPGHGMI